ncbi:hypothetical protein Ndes2437A_g02793 [Nannochloris sp. 'desiccata']
MLFRNPSVNKIAIQVHSSSFLVPDGSNCDPEDHSKALSLAVEEGIFSRKQYELFSGILQKLRKKREKKAKFKNRRKLPVSSNQAGRPVASRMQGEEDLLFSADGGEKTGIDGGMYLIYHSSCTTITQ